MPAFYPHVPGSRDKERGLTREGERLEGSVERRVEGERRRERERRRPSAREAQLAEVEPFPVGRCSFLLSWVELVDGTAEHKELRAEREEAELEREPGGISKSQLSLYCEQT